PFAVIWSGRSAGTSERGPPRGPRVIAKRHRLSADTFLPLPRLRASSSGGGRGVPPRGRECRVRTIHRACPPCGRPGAGRGADVNRVRQQVIQLLSGYQAGESVASAKSAPESAVASTSLVLDQFGRNLTQAAREGKLDPVIGREREIERVIVVLSCRLKNNP